MKAGLTYLQKGECSEAPKIRDAIIKQMTIPLIQGSLRYAYRVDVLNGPSGWTKEAAEGAVFSAAILPLVSACDSTSAKLISDNMAIDVANDQKMKDKFKAVKEAFEATYSCIGITCADVGG